MSKIILLKFSTVKTCTVVVNNFVLILYGNILVFQLVIVYDPDSLLVLLTLSIDHAHIFF